MQFATGKYICHGFLFLAYSVEDINSMAPTRYDVCVKLVECDFDFAPKFHFIGLKDSQLVCKFFRYTPSQDDLYWRHMLFTTMPTEWRPHLFQSHSIPETWLMRSIELSRWSMKSA